MRARSVRRPSTGVRSSLKSPECRITPCGVWNAVAKPCGTEWVTGMNSTSNGPICAALAVGHRDRAGPAEQPGLLDAVAGEAERERRAEDREDQLAQQERQAADVVLVAVGGDAALDAVGVLAQPREVGQHQVDAEHVGVGEHQPAVEQHDAAVASMQPQLRPISPRPPRKTDADGSDSAIRAVDV